MFIMIKFHQKARSFYFGMQGIEKKATISLDQIQFNSS